MNKHPYTSVWDDLREVEFSQGFLEAGPYRTRYLHAGDRSRPVLLLLHGITGHAEAYVRNLAAHAENFSVWAIDFIGHGYSAKPDHPLEIPHYVDQISHVLDALGADNVNTGIARIKLGRTLRLAGRYADAEIESLAGYEILAAQASPSISFLRAARDDLVLIYEATGQTEKAAGFRQEIAALDNDATH
mgnify:CR=1 FL=1